MKLTGYRVEVGKALIATGDEHHDGERVLTRRGGLKVSGLGTDAQKM